MVAAKCGSDAEREVEAFHRQLDAGNFVDVYAATDPDLKKATTEQDFVAKLDAVHRKLGTVRASRRDGSERQFDERGHDRSKLNFQ